MSERFLLIDDGERMVPEFHRGKVIYAEHMTRYLFAAPFVAGRVVLDVASGSGYGSDLLKRAGAAEVVGVDLLPNAVAYAHKYHSSAAPRFVVGDGQKLPFGDSTFDVVVSFETLEHVPDYNLFLVEMRRVLKKTGLLVLSTPNKEVYPAGNPFHVKEFSEEELTDILKGMFGNVEVWAQGEWLASAVLPSRAFATADLKTGPAVGTLNVEAPSPRDSTYLLALCSDELLPKPTMSIALTSILESADAQHALVREEWEALNEERGRISQALANSRVLLSEKELMLTERERQVAALDERICEALSQLLEQAEQLREREEQLAATELELDAVRNEPGFRVLEGLRRLADRLAPWGTLRRRILQLPVRGVAFLFGLGPRAFVLRVLQPWKWLPRLRGPETVRVEVRSVQAPRPGLGNRLAAAARRGMGFRRAYGWRAFSSRLLAIWIWAPKLLQRTEWVLTAPSAATLDGRQVQVLAKLDPDVPNTVAVGRGTVLLVKGRIYHPHKDVRNLKIVVDGREYPTTLRPTTEAYGPPLEGYEGPVGLFWSFVLLGPCESGHEARIELRATPSEDAIHVGSVTITPEYAPEVRPRLPVGPRTGSLVAICMTTFNPPIELFRRQVESLKAQTHRDWICLIRDDCSDPSVFRTISETIKDDPRFYLHRGTRRLGFYNNFEACLSMVPDSADFVALCDHDDYWLPHKLETLLGAFEDDTTLVYSDMNIVGREGEVLSKTFWTNRPNNYTDLASLLMANTITGAASLFRRKLLDYVLPFPQRVGESYHDHWIGCAALTFGKLKFIDQPLYDYVQHQANAIGHYAPPRDPLVKSLLVFIRSLVFPAPRAAALGRWRAIYFADVHRIQLISQVLLARSNSIEAKKRRAVTGLGRMDRSLATASWLFLRGIAQVWKTTATLGAEYNLLEGLLWHRLDRVKAAAPQAASIRPPAPPAEPLIAVSGPVESLGQVRMIDQKIRPLRLEVSPESPRRINILIPTIDLNYFFGGYISKLNLARKLALEGFKVRIVIVDYCDYSPQRWKERFRAFSGLEDITEQVEFAYHFDRSLALQVNRDDVLIASTWWTAHIAHDAARNLAKKEFLYLIQEYEPFTFPMGSLAALASESYAFPHYAIFSTAFLRDYFKAGRIGVFSGASSGAARCVVFENAITPVSPPEIKDLEARKTKKLLFYARPEDHAARNMFELGTLALAKALEDGCFGSEWEFYGIGSVEGSGKIVLAGQRSMELMNRQSQSAYARLLPTFDLGLSLMYTPHPSLVPIEMAAAGMIVVTNTFANKDRDKLAVISPNIIAVEPTVYGIRQGLAKAVARVQDSEARLEGSKVRWSMSWEDSLNKDVMDRIKAFIGRGRGAALVSRHGASGDHP